MATELSLEVAPNHAGRFADLAPADAIYKNLNSGYVACPSHLSPQTSLTVERPHGVLRRDACDCSGYAGHADTLEAFLKEVGSGRAYNTPGAARFDGSVPELYRARLKYNR